MGAMASRRLDGAALLVAAHDAFGDLEASALHTLGRIGEALLSTGAAWQIRRLAATAGVPYAPDRGALKLHLDELAAEPTRAAMIVLVGTIVIVGGEPALVTGGSAREYPEDATLPLGWIGERLRTARADQLVVVVSARSDGAGDPPSWLAPLATDSASHLVVVAASVDDRHRVVGALLAALRGDALDPGTGTVTMASLSRYLARHPGTAIQASYSIGTLAEPRPLAGMWDVGASQLAATQPRGVGVADDLTGTVLPGQLRIDGVVKRGTFGTVYRARQIQVDRDVAVKVLHPYIDPRSEDGRLFIQEIRSVGRLDHGNVVGVHHADITHDNRLFFAMELLDGEDLQELGAAGPLPRGRAVALVCQLLAGLGAAHDANLVHADVKPANAIVVARGDGERVVLIDFGLARLRTPGRTAESAGGTPAYMAPEQMQLGRVDARSDLFSVVLVLVYLMTGWQRPDEATLVPPLDELIADRELRAILARGLALEPARRYATAGELAAALAGKAPTGARGAVPAPPAPFRQLAPLTEDDHARLHGREADLATITQHALYRRSVIYTAPSGTGKTSMLRAGLVPRLDALGVRTVYLRCRAESSAALAAAIWRAAAAAIIAEPRPEITIAEAIARWHRHHGGKLVLILDQIEVALGDGELVRDALGFAAWPRDADVAVVLSIREDHLARLLAHAQPIEQEIPVVRLPPLGLDGARAAILGPLAEARLAIEPELLDALLADLQRAAAAIGPALGWGTAAAVFPPHLQLVCSVLHDKLGPSEATLTLARYRELGGFDAIVGEHLERVLETKLADGNDQIARALFVELVSPSQERTMRPEAELIAIVGDAARVTGVLEVLRAHGLVVAVRGDAGAPAWELAHDSLVPRVRAWLDARDLARRAAVEVMRYHLRRSRVDAPSLLSRGELREVSRHLAAIDALEAEWQRRTTAEAWSPTRLIARSRQVVRRTTVAVASLACAIAGLLGVGLYRGRVEAVRQAHDLGRVELQLVAFDWDPIQQRVVPVAPDAVTLSWALHQWVSEGDPGPPLAVDDVVRGVRSWGDGAHIEHIEARGGRAFLVIGRGACAPSVVPLRELPGYGKRALETVLRIPVPTCAASEADTLEIPGGTFIYGGVGDPPAPGIEREPAQRHGQRLSLAGYRIDRTEVTNAAFAVFGALVKHTDIAVPVYPMSPELAHAGEPRKPVTGISWRVAQAYCRYLGKDLPTSQQWVMAMRGGERLADGTPNPSPRRNLPWAVADDLPRARLNDQRADRLRGVADVGTHPGDVSPYGVLDLAGNAQEWTASRGPEAGTRIVRGGGIVTDSLDSLLVYMAIENRRPESSSGQFELGLRCAINRWRRPS
jgi:eukaryotic-like serine/threonine-protein kinase